MANALRATVRGQLGDLREAARRRAGELGLLGWVRSDDGVVRVHAEGDPAAVEQLLAWLRAAPGVEEVELERAKVEGHEQLAVRGVPAGEFRVLRREGGFELQLEVNGGVRAWAVPKGPSLDPADKRFAVQLDAPGDGPAEVVDQGPYEQGGRVRWPEAIERGHAVFVLHGQLLRGGFGLQRTGRGWLLVKRRDEHAAG
jgi:acylphosphatase